ncbi:1-phosphofructokinase family hexose kinase [Microbacterium oleivorans]|uniref:1-phosphofructokinase family hexose kinase n=1 Tax=Microbacterium oleivorans TaxID=273677 RepID=A0A7D5IWE9_9MICO|nr:PfkB family carbohydrate kinase [Microbacterium oleivorans]QLD11962.1 1-phosphofructokinase family hexose kinase [Microbacterium oleivorans]
MIVVVTPNPALDLTWSLPALERGESHRVAAGHTRAGGKGINVARVLHALGQPVLAVAPCAVAGDGALFSDDLRTAGIPVELVPVHGALRRSVALVEEATGTATLLNERGSAWSRTEIASLVQATIARLSDARVLVVSGSLPPGTPDGFVGSLVRKARRQGVAVIADVAGPALREAAHAGADLVKPNAVELVEATGAADPADGIRRLLDDGARMVAASFGADGLCIARSEGSGFEAVSARMPQPLRGNATGAGDAAVASLARDLVDGVGDLATLARRAAGLSAAAVLASYAGEVSSTYPALISEAIVAPGIPRSRERTPA